MNDKTAGGAPGEADYSSTLNLPRTEFPMKADLPRREPEIQRYWEEVDLYRLSLDKHAPRGSYVLHDGPPYSNGNIHIGTALQNKVPKDVTTRYRTLKGHRSPFVPGWDNHGMPIENAVSQEFRKKKEEPDRLTLRRACREYAQKWVNVQSEQFKRLGIRGDWAHPYLTMDPQYEARLVEVFGELVSGNFVYRGLRPIHWCPRDRTAVAGAEIEYDENYISTAIYVRFHAGADPDGIFGGAPLEECFTIIWTTTPWTIPANMAVAVSPAAMYVVVEIDGKRYLLAEDLAARVLVTCGLASAPDGASADAVSPGDLGIKVLRRVAGQDLTRLKFCHPLFTRHSPITLGDHVTLDVGTGVVHIAPGHGIEDFLIGQKYRIPAICPVDEKGVFTEEAGPFAGMHIDVGGPAVVDALAASGALLHQAPHRHSYPVCWRCGGPVIFRATVQWFMNLDHSGHREKCLRAIEKRVTWFPPEAAARIHAYVSGRPDWCLSRQRAWGVGIPVIYCESCQNSIVTDDSISRIAAAIRAHNSDAWYEQDVSAFLPEQYSCPDCGGTTFRKEVDTLSVWFDSGSSCRAVLDQREGLPYPADLYMEGYDQLRAWFNESLMIGMATCGIPPYRKVVSHGFTVDEQGRKMSKSVGNVVDPMKLMQNYGADILRWMAMSFDYFEDIRIGEGLLKQYADQYRDIRNRFRFMLGNLFDFEPMAHTVPAEMLDDLDRWILYRLQNLLGKLAAAYDSFQYHIATREAYQFLSSDLSAFYLDVTKERLYTLLPDDPLRRSSQTALYELTRALAIALSPILVHTTEEVWSHLPDAREQLCSVHLAEFPAARASLVDEDLAETWAPLFDVRRELQRSLDALRRDGTLKQSREAAVRVRCSPRVADGLAHFGNRLPELFVVSSVTIVREPAANGVVIEVERAEGQKCARCWNVTCDVGAVSGYPLVCARCAKTLQELETRRQG